MDRTASRPGVHLHPLFDGCDSGAIQGVLARSRRRFIRRQTVLARPDGDDEVHLVLDGLVIDYTATSAGRRVIIGLAGPGALAGLSGLRGSPRYSTASLSDSHVLSVRAAELRVMTRFQPRIASNLIHLMLASLEQREQQIEAMAHSAPARSSPWRCLG